MLLLVHEELVFAVDVSAEVFWQVRNLVNFDLEVHGLVQQVHWIVCQDIFIQLLVSLLVARDDIDVDLAIDLVVAGHDGDLARVVHQVS